MILSLTFINKVIKGIIGLDYLALYILVVALFMRLIEPSPLPFKPPDASFDKAIRYRVRYIEELILVSWQDANCLSFTLLR